MKWMQFYDKDRTHVKLSSIYETKRPMKQVDDYTIDVFSKHYPDGFKRLWYDSDVMAQSDYYRLKILLESDSSKMFYSFNDTEMTAVQMDSIVAFTSKLDNENKRYSLRFYLDTDKYLELFYKDPDEALNDLNEVNHDLDRKGFLKYVMEYREGLKHVTVTPKSSNNSQAVR